MTVRRDNDTPAMTQVIVAQNAFGRLDTCEAASQAMPPDDNSNYIDMPGIPMKALP